jgi:hypothetical protein
LGEFPLYKDIFIWDTVLLQGETQSSDIRHDDIMDSIELTKAWLAFASSLAWPGAILTIAFLFRSQLRNLIQRLQSGELAGAKFNFNEAASGFIESKIDELAGQSDPSRRALLAGEIKGVAAILGSIHPISLAILIDAAAGAHAWIGGSYLGKKKYFDELEQAGLANTKISKGKKLAGEIEARIEFTNKGRELIRSIGMPLGDD